MIIGFQKFLENYFAYLNVQRPVSAKWDYTYAENGFIYYFF